ncbi:MAG: hypothetical protein ACXWWR_02185 [Candidatus Limnocylindrales bacterium]
MATSHATGASSEFPAVVARLREILEPHRDQFAVTRDGPAGMSLEVHGLEGRPNGYFAGIRVGKRYVSYYLMAVYAFPELVEAMSPELRRRMQGKACFNFSRVDETLMAELADVTARGAQRWGPDGPQLGGQRS